MLSLSLSLCLCAIFFGMEEFYSYKEKTLQKRQSRETKYNTTKENKKIYIYLRFEITVKLKCGTTYITFTHSA